jgi:hypothetical protein
MNRSLPQDEFIRQLQLRLEEQKTMVKHLTIERDALLSATQLQKERVQVMTQQIADLHRELVRK